MAHVLPDDIHEIEAYDLPRQVQLMRDYIYYMREQINFWAKNREEEIKALRDRIDALENGG